MGLGVAVLGRVQPEEALRVCAWDRAQRAWDNAERGEEYQEDGFVGMAALGSPWMNDN